MTTLKHLFCLFILAFFTQLSAQNLVWTSLVDTGTCLSSPHAADLNNDGVLDLVTGGGAEDYYNTKSITAFDGATGNILWHVAARNRIYGSAQFMDITADNQPDVFIGGGSAEFLAINGATGEIIWEFFPQGDTIAPEEFGWYNFYTPQFIPDEDGDGMQDILVANGGNPAALPIDTINRPPGNLLVLSSANGSLLAMAEVPDGKETYISPLVYDFGNDGILDIIYGTGGETMHGSLWRTTLPDVLSGNIANSVKLIDGGPKGFIPPPSLADVTGDGEPDIIAPAYGNKITALNGVTNEVLWQINLPGTETVCTPAIGRFTDDYIPDVFTIQGIGISPTFFNYIVLMINGATGQVMVQDTVPGWSLISPLAVDDDADGFDEAIMVTNLPFAPPGPYYHQLLRYDFNNPGVSTLIDTTPGTVLGSTPWLGDLDANGSLDLVYLHNADSTFINAINGFVMRRYSLDADTPNEVAWGAYLGTNSNGLYSNPNQACLSYAVNFNSGNIDCFGQNNGYITASVQQGTPPYYYVWNGVSSSPNFSPAYTISIQNLPADSYSLQMVDGNGCVAAYNITLTEPDAIEATIDITPPDAGTANGAATVTATGGTGAYTYLWNTTPAQTTATAANLPAGVYTVTITDAAGCQITQTANVFVTGIPNSTPAAAISVYPNPASNLLQVQLPAAFANTNSGTALLTLYTAAGQVVNSFQLAPQNTTAYLDVSRLAPGMYYLKAAGNQTQLWQKVAVCR
ncbi:T9SS C-terminal target domain-containing protein [Sphingobacteriales bacterium UPWRP_1]|nr:hypothetical protein BVG80_14530 [Sphingobacteriales bacterium TSM_CSM]PSJ76615.1 T9SS C-terminal target domain-containing protein [Sphingobacteriales bacterium UPWRP_1]